MNEKNQTTFPKMINFYFKPLEFFFKPIKSIMKRLEIAFNQTIAGILNFNILVFAFFLSQVYIIWFMLLLALRKSQFTCFVYSQTKCECNSMFSAV